MYTVRFKCIGATRDRGHQSALEKANELMLTGKDVSVDLFFEPTNPVDAKAIAFKCLLDDNKWHRIGYVVKEANSALDLNQITETRLAWVKYRIDFKYSGPGFYAAVDITRKVVGLLWCVVQPVPDD